MVEDERSDDETWAWDPWRRESGGVYGIRAVRGSDVRRGGAPGGAPAPGAAVERRPGRTTEVCGGREAVRNRVPATSPKSGSPPS
ncbi:hypothetical protein GCM10010230_37850 [Streptomyces narbonensis]|nr:hypothetical protein GCM10010230_37850 [Streptomyces narbonensis]